MAKLLRKRFVDVIAESTYGQDPGGSRTALLPNSDLSISNDGSTVNRDTVRDTLSPRGHVVTDKQVSVTLPLELRGGGVDSSSNLQVPEIDSLLKASLMQREDGERIVLTNVSGAPFTRGETVTNDTTSNTVGTVADWDSANSILWIRNLQNSPSSSDTLLGDSSGASGDVDTNSEAYVYRPASDTPSNQESIFTRFDVDGLVQEIPGGRCTFSIDMSRSEIPGISFTVSGLYKEPTDSGPLSGTPLELTPQPVNGANLIIGDLDTSLVTVSQVQMDIANNVQLRGDIQAADGIDSQIITDREPTGSVDPEVETIANFNPFKDWDEANKIAVAAGIGGSKGDRVRVVMPETQYTQLPYSSRNGIATYDLGFRATGNDDEMMLIYS